MSFFKAFTHSKHFFQQYLYAFCCPWERALYSQVLGKYIRYGFSLLNITLYVDPNELFSTDAFLIITHRNEMAIFKSLHVTSIYLVFFKLLIRQCLSAACLHKAEAGIALSSEVAIFSPEIVLKSK